MDICTVKSIPTIHKTITCKIIYVRQYIPWWFCLTFMLPFSELLRLTKDRPVSYLYFHNRTYSPWVTTFFDQFITYLEWMRPPSIITRFTNGPNWGILTRLFRLPRRVCLTQHSARNHTCEYRRHTVHCSIKLSLWIAPCLGTEIPKPDSRSFSDSWHALPHWCRQERCREVSATLKTPPIAYMKSTGHTLIRSIIMRSKCCLQVLITKMLTNSFSSAAAHTGVCLAPYIHHQNVINLYKFLQSFQWIENLQLFTTSLSISLSVLFICLSVSASIDLSLCLSVCMSVHTKQLVFFVPIFTYIIIFDIIDILITAIGLTSDDSSTVRTHLHTNNTENKKLQLLKGFIVFELRFVKIKLTMT
jgi:hypothetical protein